MIVLILLSIISDWTNYGIDELRIRGKKRGVLFSSTYPIETKELREFLNKCTPRDIYGKWVKKRCKTYLKKLEKKEYGIIIKKDTLGIGSSFFCLGFRKLFVKMVIGGVINVGDSVYFPYRKWQGVVASDYLKGYIKFTPFNLTFTIGKEPIKWGPGVKGGLILDKYSPPVFDLVRISWHNPRVKFSYFTTILEEIADYSRYLVGHRVEIGGSDFNIGFSEVALFRGKRGVSTLYYFNPIVIYYPYQWNYKSDVNIFWGIDFSYITGRMNFYSEIMIDDYPYLQTKINEHPKIGGKAGVKVAFSRVYGVIEYTGVTRWTYGHKYNTLKYEYIDLPIGHPLGNDFEEIFSGVTVHLNEKIDIIGEGKIVNKGKGIVDEKYPEVFPDNYWLTGEVTKVQEVIVGVKWYNKFVITIKVGGIFAKSKSSPKLFLSLQSWR
jgi:hypothetical protein